MNKLAVLLIIISIQYVHSQNCTFDTTLCYSNEQYPTVNFSAQQALESVPNTVVYQTPLVVDIDLDCIPEIILSGTTGYSNSPRVTSGITVMNSITGNTLTSFPTAFYSWSTTLSYVVGDINLDGYPEIIVAAANYAGNPVIQRRKLICYDFSGNVLWVSDQVFDINTAQYFEGAPSLADFNQDGIPEVYVHNQIFNAQTGIMLANGGANGIGKMAMVSGIFEICQVAAADLDSNPNDLELAAGYTIYDVQISNPNGMLGNSMTPFNITIDGLLRDGLTSFADINLDGKLDVVVSTEGTETSSRLYAYYLDNTNTPTLIAKTAMPRGTTALYSNFSGPAYIGDIDGNGTPSICVARNYRLLAYTYNGTTIFQQKWVINTVDQSGCTGITSFDFNQDGLQEIVFRDEVNMKIINGNGAVPTVLSIIPCSSGTVMDMPIVADIDNSGTSKICATCGTGNTAKFRAYESNSAVPWAPSRKIWNQYGYHVFNINDDATVPQFQQNNAINVDANNYYVQSSLLDSLGNYVVPAADAFVEISCVTNDQINNQLIIEFDVINSSSASQSLVPGLNASFFDGNPETNGLLIGTSVINSVISPGDTVAASFILSPIPIISDSTIFIVINNDGSTFGNPFLSQDFDQIECDYTNNIDSFQFVPINAGLDTSFCGMQPVLLNGSLPGIYNCIWQESVVTGSFDDYTLYNTIFTPANIGTSTLSWQVNEGICILAIDEITIIFNDTIAIQPMIDEVICSGDTIQVGLTISNQYNYLWSPNPIISPNNVAQPYVSPSSTTLFIEQITDTITGCSATDSVLISVSPGPVFTPLIDQSICAGDSIYLAYSDSISNSFYWTTQNLLSPSFAGIVDSTVLFSVEVTDIATSCSVNDSVLITTLNINPFVINDYNICEGDSFQIVLPANNNVIYQISVDSINFVNVSSGDYFTSIANGYFLIQSIDTTYNCNYIDSLFINVNPIPLITSTTDTTICLGFNVDLFASSNPLDSIVWNNYIGNPITVQPILGINEYTVQSISPYGCMYNDTVLVMVEPNPSFVPLDDLNICSGDSILLSYSDSLSNSFYWTPPNLSSPVFSGVVDSTTLFLVGITDNNSGCTSIDSVLVSTSVFIPFSFYDYDVCHGDSFQVDLPINSNIIFFIAVDSVNFIPISSNDYFAPENNGYYIIQSIDTVSGCSNIDSLLITVNPIPLLSVSNDTIICYGEIVSLSASSEQQNTLIWNGNINNPISVQPNVGINEYIVQCITAFGCINYDTVVVTVVPNPTANFLFSPSGFIENNTSVVFINLSENASDYVWHFNDEFTSSEFSPVFTVNTELNESLTVTLIAFNEFNCVDSITYTITYSYDPLVFIPNSFTPDGDAHNNSFNVVFSGEIATNSYQLIIFNRWGEIIFESYDLLMGWDGTYQGRLVQDGIYTWKLRFGELKTEIMHEKIGHVTLIR